MPLKPSSPSKSTVLCRKIDEKIELLHELRTLLHCESHFGVEFKKWCIIQSSKRTGFFLLGGRAAE